MDSSKSVKKIHEPKIVDTVIFHGKYVDAAALKSKILTASAVSALFASFAAFIFFFFS